MSKFSSCWELPSSSTNFVKIGKKKKNSSPIKNVEPLPKFSDSHGIVSFEKMKQFFHLVKDGCPKCKCLNLESTLDDPMISCKGVAIKFEFFCSQNHKTSWYSTLFDLYWDSFCSKIT